MRAQGGSSPRPFALRGPVPLPILAANRLLLKALLRLPQEEPERWPFPA